jgi:hypothetical protein
MPKRVHSATDRDDISESTSASKRTRKPTELVCEYSINYHANRFFFLRIISVKNFTMGFKLIKPKMVEFSVKISFNYRRKGIRNFFSQNLLIL